MEGGSEGAGDERDSKREGGGRGGIVGMRG